MGLPLSLLLLLSGHFVNLTILVSPMVVLAAAGGIIGFLVAASGMAYRIFAAWVVAVLALWTLLQFVLHVRYPWFWVSVAALSVWINGYIATNLEGDG